MKKKILLISAAVIALAAVCVIGYTLAYFTDTAEATNTFTIGDVDILLNEEVIESVRDEDTGIWSYIGDGTRTVEGEGNKYKGVMPGAKLPKDPMVTNDGSNACYVQIEVTIPEGLIDFYPEFISFEINEDSEKAWIYSEKDSTEGVKLVYQYKSILPPYVDDGDDNTNPHITAPLFDAIIIDGSLDNEAMEDLAEVLNGNSFDIDIFAKAIQADGFETAEDAFAELNKVVTP